MGRIRKRRKDKEKKRWMSKDGKSSMVFESKIQSYLDDGWHFGHDTDKQKEMHKKYYNNGVINIYVCEGDPIPEGFVPGMWQRRPGGFSMFEYKWYTNGKESKRLSLLKGDIIPDGWWEGQSDEQAEKSRNAPKGKKRTPEQIEHHREGAKKQWISKKLNGTANISGSEERLYKNLCTRYGEDDVERNYDSDPRYPWHCDFYIKSKDLFIEVNDFPTHYIEPFDKNNLDHINLLEHCKNEPKNWVEERMVNVWGYSDILKRETAYNNNLNYLMIYDDTVYKFNDNGELIISKDFTMM